MSHGEEGKALDAAACFEWPLPMFCDVSVTSGELKLQKMRAIAVKVGLLNSFAKFVLA